MIVALFAPDVSAPVKGAALMPTQIFATVTGAKQGAFKGETTQKGFENKIPCVGFDYGVTVPHDQATGQASGKRQHKPVTITKEWGASSPQFFEAASTNETLKTVLIEVFKPSVSGVQQLDHTVLLTNASISSVEDSLFLGQAGGPAVDSRELTVVSFTFQKIEITSVTGGTSATDDWNVTA
jgi:type VI secretion system secreted protein Hcp